MWRIAGSCRAAWSCCSIHAVWSVSAKLYELESSTRKRALP